MATFRSYLVLLLVCWELPLHTLSAPSRISRGKGTTDNRPVFLNNNYIPAALHVIFHITDLLKYDLRPPGGGGAGSGGAGGSTSTTVRPTPPHKPGNYAPEVPPGPVAFFKEGNEGRRVYHDLGEKFTTPSSNPLLNRTPQGTTPLQPSVLNDIDLLGAGPSDLLRQINSLDDAEIAGENDADRVYRFAVNYNDNFNADFLRAKKQPPTKAYVTLLSLYDQMKNEAKDLNLNRYNGYGDGVLKELIKTSEGSVSEQLKFVLNKIIVNRNTRKEPILNKIRTLLRDLEKPESYINDAIRYIPALKFAP